MEGATRSGLMVADEIIARADGEKGLKAQSRAAGGAAGDKTESNDAKVPFFASA